jgi:hypothetical protein
LACVDVNCQCAAVRRVIVVRLQGIEPLHQPAEWDHPFVAWIADSFDVSGVPVTASVCSHPRSPLAILVCVVVAMLRRAAYRYFGLGDNQLTGTIPPFLGSVTRLM